MRGRQIAIAVKDTVTGSARRLMSGVKRGMLPSLRNHRLVFAFIAAVVLAGALSVWWLSLPPEEVEHMPVGVQIAHAAIGDKKGCATCHAEAIPYTTCSDTGCHAPLASPYQITPTTYVINFPHHNTGNTVGAPSDCQSCHATVPNDARYVTIPTASHSGLCGTCHNRTHS